MKIKDMIIGISIVVVILAGLIFIARMPSSRKPAAQPAVVKAKEAAKTAVAVKAPVRKAFSKDMGGLTVRMMGAKDKEIGAKVRAFRGSDKDFGILAAAFTTNRMQELPAGNYDIEVDTVPQTIFKNINVANGKETVKDLGRPTGSLTVKMLNSKKKEANYAVRVFHPKSNFLITNSMANRPLEIVAGVYDVEIGVAPKIIEGGVKIEPGKDKVLDLGPVTGALLVKAVDENKKEGRFLVRVKRQEKGDIVSTGTTGRPMEILAGTYAVELVSAPIQTRKDINISEGEETTVEFEVKAVPAAPVKAPAPPVAAPVKPAGAVAPAPVKK